MSREKLRKIGDVECEKEYGYVYNISGPSMKIKVSSLIKVLTKF